MSKLQPKRDSAGRYYRNIGYTRDGSRSQPKFYLGRDEVQATERLARIIRLWQWVRDDLHKDEPRAIWGPLLDLAKAIGAGGTVYRLPKSRFRADGVSEKTEDAAYATALALLSMQPVIEIVAEDEPRLERGEEQLSQIGKRQKFDEKAEQALTLAEAWRELSGQRPLAGDLHEVLEAFWRQLETTYPDPTYDCISDTGKTRQSQVKTLLRLLPNTPLVELDFGGCQEIYNVLRRRPPMQDKRPYEHKTCQHLIATLNLALEYADISDRWKWELPPKFGRIKRAVARIEQDNDRQVEVAVYTPAEITTLWRFARPQERLLLSLALNCGMGADQIGRLTIKRIRLRDDGASYIKSRRYKKDVIGRWRLWNVTEQLIRWAIARRPRTDHDILVVNGKGNSLYGKSKNGNRSRQIANMWYNVLNRIRKKKPDFRRLGFNSLRDTSADFVRQIARGELASIHLAHKHHTTDGLLHCYTNPNFKQLAQVHKRIEEKLADVWAAVPDPTQEPPRSNSSAFARMEV